MDMELKEMIKTTYRPWTTWWRNRICMALTIWVLQEILVSTSLEQWETKIILEPITYKEQHWRLRQPSTNSLVLEEILASEDLTD